MTRGELIRLILVMWCTFERSDHALSSRAISV
jgi:hypothetical protein